MLRERDEVRHGSRLRVGENQRYSEVSEPASKSESKRRKNIKPEKIQFIKLLPHSKFKFKIHNSKSLSQDNCPKDSSSHAKSQTVTVSTHLHLLKYKPLVLL